MGCKVLDLENINIKNIVINKDLKFIRIFLEDNVQLDFISTDELENIKQHISEKIDKNFKYEMGMSDTVSDRLFTETVVELQVILDKIDKLLDKNGKNNTPLKAVFSPSKKRKDI